MHEFSLCQNIIKIVDQTLSTHKDDHLSIKKIVLTVGKLACVDVESLKFWFPVVLKETVYPKAQLEIIELDSIAKCASCSEIFQLDKLYQACPFCSSYEREILKGCELLVKEIQFS